MKLHPDLEEITAFKTALGLLHWKVLLMGYENLFSGKSKADGQKYRSFAAKVCSGVH